MDQPVALQRFVRTHAELFRAVLPLLARQAGGRPRAPAARTLRRFGEAGGPGRNLSVARERRQRRQPGQPPDRLPPARQRGVRPEERQAAKERQTTEFRVPRPDARPGATHVELCAHAGAARHRLARAACGQRAVQRAAQELRLRHGDVELDGLAVARQRAALPLVDGGRDHARHL